MLIQNIAQKNIAPGTRVLLRLDWNITREQASDISHTRIAQTIETIRFLQSKKARTIICSHRGRPDGRDQNASLLPIVHELNKQLDINLKFSSASVMTEINKIAVDAQQLKEGEVLVLENIRFYEGEYQNSPELAGQLAQIADVYVNDAFGACHRSHASIDAIAEMLPVYAGLLIQKELAHIDHVQRPKMPAVALFGGAKLDSKIGAIEKLVPHYSVVGIGSALANVFFAALNMPHGKILFETAGHTIEKVRTIWEQHADRIYLPVDVIVADIDDEQQRPIHKKSNELTENDLVLDIGPESIRELSQKIKNAQTIVWNGPMGLYEKPAFKHGTMAIARLIGSRAKGKAFGIAGGGETIQAIHEAGAYDDFDFISTGGGALLEYLAGETLPGIERLKNNKQ
jgi:phosphoglycerate kinase